MKTNNFSRTKIILILWLVFSVLYVGYNEYKRIKVYGLDRAYKQGISDAVVRVIQQAQTCKAFPVKFQDTTVQLLNVECLTQQPGAEGQQAQPAENQ